MLGRLEEARPQTERGLALDPFNALFRTVYGMDLLYERRYDDAVTELHKALPMEPDNLGTVSNMLSAAHLAGRHEEALATFRRYFPDDRGFQDAVSRGYAAGGYRPALRRGADYLGARTSYGRLAPFTMADFYALAGEKDSALAFLERGYQLHDPNMPYMLAPDFDVARNAPRFVDLRRRIGLPTEPTDHSQ